MREEQNRSDLERSTGEGESPVGVSFSGCVVRVPE